MFALFKKYTKHLGLFVLIEVMKFDRNMECESS